MKAFVIGAVLAVGVFACDDGPRRDAATVVGAIGRFRAADNSSMPAMLEALKATPCQAADACQAKSDCVASGESTVRSLLLKADVEKSIGQLEKGTLEKTSLDAQTLPSKLDEAERLLKQGFDGLAKCDEQVQALKRKHRI